MLLSRLNSENKILFRNFEIHLANADGNISDTEKALIDTHCAEMGIGNNNYQADGDINDIIRDIPSHFSDVEKKIAYTELVALAFVDDIYTEEEKDFLDSARKAFNLTPSMAEQAESIVGNLVRCTKELEAFAGII